MRLNQAGEAGKGRARPFAMRPAVVLIAVLVAFSLSSFGAGHAHAEAATYSAFDQAVAAAAKAPAQRVHVHAEPCDDGVAGHGSKVSCCMSVSACGFCAPVPSADFAFVAQEVPSASAPGSASLPRIPQTLRRPPKLSIAA